MGTSLPQTRNKRTKRQLAVIILVFLMVIVRFGLAFIAYLNPSFLMMELGFPLETNQQAPYLGRVWAIRDMAISGLVVYSLMKKWLNPVLIACIIIDFTDILSAYLGSLDGLFDQQDTISLMLTALIALIPESVALLLNVNKSNK